jgi:pyrroline-5-carboxylate reductase
MSSTGTAKPQCRIVCIGGGNMARALIGGWIATGFSASQLAVAEPNESSRLALTHDFGIQCFSDNQLAVQQADVWLLAVKPQLMPSVCQALRAQADVSAPLVISIAAGISTTSLQSWLGDAARIVRSMPNTPALIGQGATGLFAGTHVESDARDVATALMRSVGKTVWLAHEQQMDAVTATSGSGPAYFFLLIEAMQQAAIELGLAPETARELVLQTALGAATMARNSDKTAAELRISVTSPGGTTQAALEVFNDGQFSQLVKQALGAAQARGREMSQQFGA